MMNILAEGARAQGLHLTDEQLHLFETYYQELVSWNEKTNLTAVTEREPVQTRHFLDSLSVIQAFPVLVSTNQPISLIDVGTGAGFPGIPLRIACPQLVVTLLEATGKRTAFLQHVITLLGLDGVSVITGRAEEVGHESAQRERYDVVVARAVAKMATLTELCLPFARVGGHFIAMKGSGVEPEVNEAQHAINLLGGEVRTVKPVIVPGSNEERTLIVIGKTASTPSKYPRRSGMPAKRPL
jgi:16S rRNA (guanine527-N7)-methyltransferase